MLEVQNASNYEVGPQSEQWIEYKGSAIKYSVTFCTRKVCIIYSRGVWEVGVKGAGEGEV